MSFDFLRDNLKEKDIEDYLVEHPGLIVSSAGNVHQWIKRQFSVPSGIVDLVGLTAHGRIVVVEVKNVAIDAAALTQVSRYAHDLDQVVGQLAFQITSDDTEYPEIAKVVFGRSIDKKTLLEAEALGIDVLAFSVEVQLCVRSMNHALPQEFVYSRNEQYKALCDDGDIIDAVQLYEDSYQEMSRRLSGEIEGLLDSEAEPELFRVHDVEREELN